jgi:hypothetical protein
MFGIPPSWQNEAALLGNVENVARQFGDRLQINLLEQAKPAEHDIGLTPIVVKVLKQEGHDPRTSYVR